jgi:epsin
VLTYLIKNGNEKVITSIREHLFDLKSLETFAYHDENNKDQGINSNICF